MPAYEPGVFLNGFYEHRPIAYGEHAYGFPRLGQSILNCPDGTIVKLFIDDEPFVVTEAEVVSLHRTLDLRRGMVQRNVGVGHARRPPDAAKDNTIRVLRAPAPRGDRVRTVCAGDGETNVVISSELRPPATVAGGSSSDPRLAVGLVGRVLHPKGTHRKGMRVVLSYATKSSRLILGCGIDHVLEVASPFSRWTRHARRISRRWRFKGRG